MDPQDSSGAFRAAAAEIARRALAEISDPLSREEKERLIEDALSEAVGLGPLGPFFRDPSVSDILVNGPYHVYVERFGRLERTEARFRDASHLLNLIERIVARVGRHIDTNSPMVDARLPDGSRINAVIPPLSLTGPILSIRRFGSRRLSPEDLVRLGTVSRGLLDLFRTMVESRLNIQISGGTGSGKTTLLNVLSSFIGDRERIITIEDAAELQLQKDHVVRLEARPANIEGRGEVTIRQLVVNALRMRPDRIIVGEVRSHEAFDMIQAMSTGHDGSMTTIHANSARDALKRLEAMILMAGFDLPSAAVRQMIAAALDVLIHVERLRDGSRRVVSVSEVLGLEKDTLLTQEIVVFEENDPSAGRVSGAHRATGVVPAFLSRFRGRGPELGADLFERGRPL